MTDFKDVAMAGVELAVTIGIVEAAIDQTTPEEVKENFEEKVDQLVQHLRTETEEFMRFGEAYDGG